MLCWNLCRNQTLGSVCLLRHQRCRWASVCGDAAMPAVTMPMAVVLARTARPDAIVSRVRREALQIV
jgi:hypothetical protein